MFPLKHGILAGRLLPERWCQEHNGNLDMKISSCPSQNVSIMTIKRALSGIGQQLTSRWPSLSCALARFSQKSAWVTLGRSARPGALGTDAPPASSRYLYISKRHACECMMKTVDAQES